MHPMPGARLSEIALQHVEGAFLPVLKQRHHHVAPIGVVADHDLPRPDGRLYEGAKKRKHPPAFGPVGFRGGGGKERTQLAERSI